MGILLLASCSKEDVVENESRATDSNIAQTVAIQENTLPVRTLTVLAPYEYEWEVHRAELRMRYEAENYLPEDERFRFEIDLTLYDRNDWENQLQSLQIKMMAGDSYDLFFLDRHPLWHYAQAGFLVDFYTLIDADPHVSMEDFFLSPLAAMEIDGGLYSLPMSFGFHYAFINASLPEHMIHRFSQYNAVTFSDLMDIYIELQQNYGYEFGHLNFFGGSPPFASNGPNRVLESYMVGFIDMDNRTANLVDNCFIDFLYRHRQAFTGWNADDRIYYWRVRPGHLRERSREDAFWIASTYRDPGYAVYSGQMQQPYFLHGIPMIDTGGRLMISPEHGVDGGTRASVCITVGTNSKLAWGFSKHLVHIFDYWSVRGWMTWYPHDVRWRPHTFLMTSSISRDLYAYDWISNFWLNFYMPNYVLGRTHIIEQDIEYAMVRISAYNEMPMAMAFPFIPEDLTAGNIDLFNRGLISAEVLAQRLQNSISIWLLGG